MVKPILRETLTEKSYEAIKSAILHSEFLPGRVLSIEGLASKLATSQTPVREALVKLAAEGFVEQGSNKRLRVTRISEKDIRETYEVRRLLEPYATRLIASSLSANPHLSTLIVNVKADNEAIHEIAFQRDKLSPSQHKKYMEIDLRLNNVIWEGIENSLLAGVFNLVSNNSMRIRSYAEASAGESEIALVRVVTKEHALIIDALLSEDPDRAEEAAKTHLEKAEQRTLRALPTSTEEGKS